MHITATILAGGIVAALPVAAVTDIRPVNPFDALSVSAAGVGIEIDADGVETAATDHTDFQIELRLKSGAPIRIRL